MDEKRPQPEEYTIYEGNFLTAEWYFTRFGQMPAFDYYKDLKDVEQTRLDDMIRHVCDRPFGVQLPLSMYRVEDADNKIYALKPRAHRYFNFTTADARLIVTNAYRKHSMKMGKLDLEKLRVAATHREDYLRRTKEATYYAQ